MNSAVHWLKLPCETSSPNFELPFPGFTFFGKAIDNMHTREEMKKILSRLMQTAFKYTM